MKTKRHLFNFFLGAVTCLLLISVSTVSFSKNVATPLQNENTAANTSQPFQTAQIQRLIDQAESVFLAQGISTTASQRYAAALNSDEVVPTTPSTSAFAGAGAVLVGNLLIVRGGFSHLSSPLRDYATDPVSPPNPNITSAVHIHRGEPTANGPFQYALNVTTAESKLAGSFAGDYTLTSEQLQALSSGGLYMDMHTTRNRGGELRAILKPYTFNAVTP